MESFFQDIRYGVRTLLRNPGFALVAMLSLALGIGANTAIFTITNAVFLNSLPVQEPSRLAQVQTSDLVTKSANALFNVSPVSVRNYEDFRVTNDVFTGLAGFVAFGSVTLSGRGDPTPLPVQLATANYFDVLGVKAVLGRTFYPDEDKQPGGNTVAVLSHAMWINKFGGERSLIGQTINLNQTAYIVIGVTPPEFKGTVTVAAPELMWVPISMHSQVLSGALETLFDNRRLRILSLFGRLKPGVEIRQADAAMKTLASRLEREYPLENAGRTAVVTPLAEGTLGFLAPREQLVIAAIALSAVVGLVLLIACFNLANMLLARAARRQKELSIRTALGAGRGRMVRQLLTESMLLAIGGGVGGLVIAVWGRELLWSFRPAVLPPTAIQLTLDPRVLMFTVGMTLITGLVFGLAPALRASSPHVNEVLKTGGRGNTSAMSGGLRKVLVVAQVTLTVIALAGAGLFIRSMQNAQRVDPGFESHNLLSFGMDLSTLRWSPERGVAFQRTVLDEVRSLPGVEAAALASSAPLTGGFLRTVLKQGQESEANPRGNLIMIDFVSPEFFDTLRIPLHDGRAFTEFDRADTAPLTIVNEAAARQFWPGEQVVGRKLYFLGETVMRQVVGLVPNVVTVSLGEVPQPILYMPMAQNYQPFVTVQVRTKGPPEAVLPTALAAVQRMNSSLALVIPNTIQNAIGQGLWAPRMAAALFGIFGALGLTLAAIGIYGVMAYMVAQRTNEIGIRMALGARPGDVLRMVVGESMQLALLGIVIGVVGALALARAAGSLLFGVSTADPVTYAAVSLVLAAAAALAGAVPAWRASRIDPVVALRD